MWKSSGKTIYGMKFLADEHIELSVVKGLNKIGIEIISIDDLGKKGLNDRKILHLGKNGSRIVVTRDSDFLKLHAQGFVHSGIIFIPAQMGIGG